MIFEELLIKIQSHPLNKWIKLSNDKYKTKIQDLDVVLQESKSSYEMLSDDVLSDSYPPARYTITLIDIKESIEITEEQGELFENLCKRLKGKHVK